MQKGEAKPGVGGAVSDNRVMTCSRRRYEAIVDNLGLR